jgi:20S proteasome subunit beta 3
MAGKNCVAIGSDTRFGVQFQTLATDYKKVRRRGRRKKENTRRERMGEGVGPDPRAFSSHATQNRASPHLQVYKIHDKLYMGLAGLGTDAQTL